MLSVIVLISFVLSTCKVKKFVILEFTSHIPITMLKPFVLVSMSHCVMSFMCMEAGASMY